MRYVHRTVSFITYKVVSKSGRCEGAREKQKFVSMSDPIIRLEKGIRYVECDPSNLGDSEREIVPEKWDQKLRVIVVRLFFFC